MAQSARRRLRALLRDVIVQQSDTHITACFFLTPSSSIIYISRRSLATRGHYSGIPQGRCGPDAPAVERECDLKYLWFNDAHVEGNYLVVMTRYVTVNTYQLQGVFCGLPVTRNEILNNCSL